MYSIRRAAAHPDEVSPLRVTRFDESVRTVRFQSALLLLICRRLPSFSRPIFSYSSDGVLTSANLATYSCNSLKRNTEIALRFIGIAKVAQTQRGGIRQVVHSARGLLERQRRRFLQERGA